MVPGPRHAAWLLALASGVHTLPPEQTEPAALGGTHVTIDSGAINDQCATHGTFRQRMANYRDVQYHADISVSGQVLQGVFDTGSPDLVVFSRRCSTCGSAPAYDEQRSQHFINGSSSREYSYGSGSCYTEDAEDTVALGCYTSEHQEMQMALKCNMPVLSFSSFNAIVGVGPPEQSEADARTTPRKSLMEQLNIWTFSACYSSVPRSPGWIIWNDTTREGKAGVKRAPVVGSTTWSVRVTSLSLHKQASAHLDLGCENGCGAIVDTGSSLIGVPSTIYDKISDFVESRSDLEWDCSALDGLPDLHLTLAGHSIRLSAASYLGGLRGQPSEEASDFLRSTEYREGGTCELVLMDLGEQKTQFGPLLVLGIPFLREYYTTFDLGPPGRGDRSLFVSMAATSCNQEMDQTVMQLSEGDKRQHLALELDAPGLRAPKWLRHPGEIKL